MTSATAGVSACGAEAGSVRPASAATATASSSSGLTASSTSLPAQWMLRAVRWYQRHISAYNPPCCKYYPSCSNYAIQAVQRYGAFRGGVLAVLRLLRCRPWSLGGIDDVPQHYSLFYRFSWSRAHEEPRLTPLASSPSTSDVAGGKETA